MTLEHTGGGWESISCDKCGYYNSWEWEDEGRPYIPTECSQCGPSVPLMEAMAARMEHWWAMKRPRPPDYIGSIWASETRDAIEHMELLDKMLE